MEPIKIEVAINVNVDMSQGTKDFLLKVLERKIEAENERTEKAASPLLSLLSLAQSGCNKPAGPIGTIGPDGTPISTEAQIESDALNEAAKAAEAKKAAEKKAEPSKKRQESEKTISIEDVRAVLTTKVNDHREAIRSKLESFGAKSVTTLDPSKYQEMHDFLASL